MANGAGAVLVCFSDNVPILLTKLVNGMCIRLQDQDPSLREPWQPFKHGMRLRLLGTVAWLEFPRPRCSRHRIIVLRLADDDGAAILIDWRPWLPDLEVGRLEATGGW